MSSRLDAAMAASGQARSRTHAATLIADGRVSVDGRTVTRSATKVEQTAEILVEVPDHYVSRAAHKLIAALDGFGIAVAGRTALDLGASTGGFTQVLRERSADTVIALDVGHGQLDPRIAADAAVHSVEGCNVRHLTATGLAESSGVARAPDLITGDLSFISLGHVFPAVAAVAAESADIALLVKPQFEVGRTAVRGGIVTDPTLHASAVAGVLRTAFQVGLGTLGVMRSPLAGTHGNVEFLVHLAPDRGTDPTQWNSEVERVTGGRWTSAAS